MTHAIRIHEIGGPEKMVWDEVSVGEPGEGELRMRQTAVGLNFIDTYHRTGLYPLPELPGILGREAAGIVVAVGPGVADFAPGDRVAYPMVAGAYCEERIIATRHLVHVPEGVEDPQAAAMMLKGLTTRYLLRKSYAVRQGETILIHAAAGGVGLLACQWAKHLGARVLGTVGSREKAELAQAHGCDHPILYREEDFVARVRELTDGAGVPVVYDSVGRETFDRSLDCLMPLGTMVSFGNSSGAVPPVNIGVLSAKGSLYLTRPTLATHIARREDLVAAADELFDLVARKIIKVEVKQTYPLCEAAQAHRDLESRRTTGSTVFLP